MTCTRCSDETLYYYVLRLDNGHMNMVLGHDAQDAREVGKKLYPGRRILDMYVRVVD